MNLGMEGTGRSDVGEEGRKGDDWDEAEFWILPYQHRSFYKENSEIFL